jgi:hypothetical protein
MLDQLTSSEVADVIEFGNSEPFGEDRADHRAGMLALVAARAAGAKSAKLKDFIPDWTGERDRDMTSEEVEAAMNRFCREFKRG